MWPWVGAKWPACLWSLGPASRRPQPQTQRPSLPIPQGSQARPPTGSHRGAQCPLAEEGALLGGPPHGCLLSQCCEAIYSSVSGLKAHLASCSKVSPQALHHGQQSAQGPPHAGHAASPQVLHGQPSPGHLAIPQP